MDNLRTTRTLGMLRRPHPCPGLAMIMVVVVGLATLFSQALSFAGEEVEKKFHAKPIHSSNLDPLEGGSAQTFSVMEEQLRFYREELGQSEDRLQSFRQRHGLISLDDQRRLLLTQRQDLDTSLKAARNRAEGLSQKLSWLKNHLRQIPERVALSSVRDQIIDQAQTNFLNLQLKEQELLDKYQPDNRLVVTVRKEIELMKHFLNGQEAQWADTVTTGKNPLFQEIEMQLLRTEAELISVNAQSEVIQQQITEVDQELTRLNSLEKELNGLRRQVTTNEQQYLDYVRIVGTTPPQDYRIQVGDQLAIKFLFSPELNEEVWVRPDGRIALQLVGEIQVAGQTVQHVRETLIDSYSKQHMKNPEIAVILGSLSF